MRRRELMVSGEDRWWESPEYDNMEILGEFSEQSSDSQWEFTVNGYTLSYNGDVGNDVFDTDNKRLCVPTGYCEGFFRSPIFSLIRGDCLKAIYKVTLGLNSTIWMESRLEYLDISKCRYLDGELTIQGMPMLETLILPEPGSSVDFFMQNSYKTVEGCPSLKKIKCSRLIMEAFKNRDLAEIDQSIVNQIEWDLYD